VKSNANSAEVIIVNSIVVLEEGASYDIGPVVSLSIMFENSKNTSTLYSKLFAVKEVSLWLYTEIFQSTKLNLQRTNNLSYIRTRSVLNKAELLGSTVDSCNFVHPHIGKIVKIRSRHKHEFMASRKNYSISLTTDETLVAVSSIFHWDLPGIINFLNHLEPVNAIPFVRITSRYHFGVPSSECHLIISGINIDGKLSLTSWQKALNNIELLIRLLCVAKTHYSLNFGIQPIYLMLSTNEEESFSCLFTEASVSLDHVLEELSIGLEGS